MEETEETTSRWMRTCPCQARAGTCSAGASAGGGFGLGLSLGGFGLGGWSRPSDTADPEEAAEAAEAARAMATERTRGTRRETRASARAREVGDRDGAESDGRARGGGALRRRGGGGAGRFQRDEPVDGTTFVSSRGDSFTSIAVLHGM